MVTMSYILFICVSAPMVLMIPAVKKESRKVIIFTLIGMCVCLFVSEINGLLSNQIDENMLFFTTNITPVTEEITKAIPIFFYAIFISDRQEDLLTIAFATGVGFAILENLVILTQNFSNVDLIFAVIRGFSSGLMHSICTMMVALFISLVHKKKKLFRVGTLAFLALAIVYHSIFNSLIQAESGVANYFGYFLPIATYILVLFVIPSSRFVLINRNKEKEKA